MDENERKVRERLLEQSDEFRGLHERHHELKIKVRDAELGHVPMDSMRLGELKREKLRTKDRMAVLIAAYEENRASSSV